MTDKPTPTDAELKAMWQLHAADIGGIFHYARAVLAKWGQPAQAAEPFCWQWENTFNGGTGAVKKNPETLGINMSHPDYKWTALYTTPQPSPTAQSAEPVAWLDPWTGTKVTTDYDAYGKHGIPLYTAPQPVAREPLPKFLALKFHARRDKKATVTLLFPGHEAADAWVRGIKGGQHG